MHNYNFILRIFTFLSKAWGPRLVCFSPHTCESPRSTLCSTLSCINRDAPRGCINRAVPRGCINRASSSLPVTKLLQHPELIRNNLIKITLLSGCHVRGCHSIMMPWFSVVATPGHTNSVDTNFSRFRLHLQLGFHELTLKSTECRNNKS